MTTVPPIVYGEDSPLLTRGEVEKNMLAHVQAWLIDYLRRVERLNQLDAGSLAEPRSWEVVNEYTRYPEEGMPFIAVLSPGIAPGFTPRREGDGYVTAWWMLAVGAIVATRDERSAKDLAGYYGAAIRGLVMEQPQLGGWASGADWTDEKYDDFPRVTERTMAAVRLTFIVEVQGVMNLFGAPRTASGELIPPYDPYTPPTDFPTVNTYDIDVEVQQ